jgi:hypothetical protein
MTGEVLTAAHVLARIADAYDDNRLDNEARKRWGPDDEITNARRPVDIILYTSRGGGTLLTLADCLEARQALRRATQLPNGRSCLICKRPLEEGQTCNCFGKRQPAKAETHNAALQHLLAEARQALEWHHIGTPELRERLRQATEGV